MSLPWESVKEEISLPLRVTNLLGQRSLYSVLTTIMEKYDTRYPREPVYHSQNNESAESLHKSLYIASDMLASETKGNARTCLVILYAGIVNAVEIVIPIVIEKGQDTSHEIGVCTARSGSTKLRRTI